MNKLTAKEYLQQIKGIDVKINLHLARLEIMKSKAIYSGNGVTKSVSQPRTSKDGLGEKVCDIIMLTQEIERRIERFMRAKEKVINQITGLENAVFIQVLYKRYFEYKTWVNISSELHYSFSYIKQIHRDALSEFEAVYADELCCLETPY